MPLIVITCESCGSQYHLDSARLAKPKNKVRCTKCKHVFLVDQPDEDALIYIDVEEGEEGFIPETFQQEESVAPPPVSPKKRSSSWRALLFVVPLLLVLGAAFYYSMGSSLFTGATTTKTTTPPKEPTTPTVTIMDSLQAFYLENVQAGQVPCHRGGSPQ